MMRSIFSSHIPHQHGGVLQHANKWEALISSLERHDLDACEEQEIGAAGGSPVGPLDWIGIDGIERLWTESEVNHSTKHSEETPAVVYPMEDVLSGLASHRRVCAFFVMGEPTRIQVFLAAGNKPMTRASSCSETGAIAFQRLLQSAYCALDIRRVSPKFISRQLSSSRLAHAALVCGVPTSKPLDGPEAPSQIERICRALYGSDWGYLVVAIPVSPGDTVREVNTVLGQQQDIQGKEDLEKNPRAHHCIGLLQAQLDHLKLGQALGMWHTSTYFFSPDPNTFEHARAIIKASLGGEKSTPSSIRVLRVAAVDTFISGFQLVGSTQVSGHVGVASPLSTPLNSRNLATLIHLPANELSGFHVHWAAKFAVDFRPLPATSVRIGKILATGSQTGNHYRIGMDELAKHSLVVGVPGSGKTNTCFYVLLQLWQDHKVPFLVVEPAKTEYRNLICCNACREKGQVFTLGDETVAPFRLNPFEVMPGIHIQTHIDLLKSVFNASFVLYAPMPYILERCLNEIYLDKGWDLVTNQNRRLPEHISWDDPACPANVFPTLRDLYRKVDEVVAAYGYDRRIEMDVRAGLKARIGSLRLGGKGTMLDARTSTPITRLLDYPTVLELESVGDDEEKSFIIGLLMMRLYEYRRVEGSRDTLQHVLLVEEAHRLLKRTSSETTDLESSNSASKAVETFADVLAEIRAYGQGIMVADQIPNKLAIEVLKNTNLKIMHRIVAEDDRETMGGAMNLDETQRRHAGTLDCGHGLAFAEGTKQAYLVNVDFDKSKAIRLVRDREDSNRIVQQQMERFCSSPLYDRFPACSNCPVRCDRRIADLAARFLENDDRAGVAQGYVFAAVLDPDTVFRGLSNVRAALHRFAGRQLKPDQLPHLMYCILVHCIDSWGDCHGDYHLWLYNVASDLKQRLTNALAPLPCKLEKKQGWVNRLKVQLMPDLKRISHAVAQLSAMQAGPCMGCTECQYRCLFGPEISAIINDHSRNERFTRALGASDCAGQVRRVSHDIAADLAPGVDSATTEAIGLCYVVQKLQRLNARDAPQLVKEIFASESSRKTT